MAPTAQILPENRTAGPAGAGDRFRTDPMTLVIDRFMTRFIRVGGVGLIAAVFAIFVFILWQILPLFQGARAAEEKTVALPPGDYVRLGLDEWGEMPFLVDRAGQVTFISADSGAVQRAEIAFAEPKTISAFRYRRHGSSLVYGTADGFFAVAPVQYEADFAAGGRKIRASVEPGPFYEITAGLAVQDVDWGDAGGEKLAAAIVQDSEGRRFLRAVLLGQERTLFGAGETSVAGRFDLTDLAGRPERVLVNATADGVLAISSDTVDYFVRRQGKMERVQRFQPFLGETDAGIARADFVFGDVSVVFCGRGGQNRVYSLFAQDGVTRLFHPTKQFKPLPGAPVFYAPSLRNKAFLTGTDDFASLRYVTTESVRWEKKLPFRARDAAINAKYNRIVFLDEENRLHFFKLDDPHPEASFKAFFGKIWYEGSPAPKYEWQSTGGSDEFEPKLSLVPLIIGTLKGTLYAMVFAIPIALLAALYTSQFLSAKVRAVAKPVMEIMASLPSVVLGFLAALWLAPLIETRVPSIVLMLFLLPAAAIGCGEFFRRLPAGRRGPFRPGLEFLYFLPVMAAVMALCWAAGPALESVFFVTRDPQTGARVADFRLWWPQAAGASFEQRNSLAVGFMMGFAVIPIIFTIAEDSFSNVPHSLRAGSLALGASRWQTALNVVLPTASAGIFSAVMIGLGRAIGETMIVVMATGNTPIMDFNIFSGMRTLSANIAVELPEAPHHGTLYRTLFLGAMVLFLATFFVNTLAEILRQRLREKYKTV